MMRIRMEELTCLLYFFPHPGVQGIGREVTGKRTSTRHAFQTYREAVQKAKAGGLGGNRKSASEG